jgi:hypothetical protein
MFTSFFLDISSTNTYKIIFKKKKGVGPERVVKKMAVCCGHIFILIETSAGTHIFEKALTPHLALLASSVSSVYSIPLTSRMIETRSHPQRPLSP